MPHSRRRKFSVRNRFAGREPSKVDRGFQTSAPGLDPGVNNPANNIVTNNASKSKSRMHPNSSRNSNNIDVTSECESTSTMITAQKQSNITIDKDVTATASNIDLFHIMYATEYVAEPLKAYIESFNTIDKNKTPPKRITRQVTQDRASMKRDKYPRQHRIKVRSPKRRIGIGIIDTQNKSNDINKLTASTGTEAIDWEHETQLSAVNVLNVPDTIEDDERQSDHSSDDMCRICHGGDGLSPELGLLISACSCRGTVGRVHVKCLERWLTESGKSRCELCGTRYATRRVHRYGVPRALVMWILSQNAKQLMVDSLGIMLMSPLAVLAAWLSGRTLAGLMTQDAHSTPWPLASTFVLACMTLVCYYCWIVSAATRHALGWWIWYRSQYEVRLELDIEE